MILSLSISLSAQQTPPAETPQAPQAQATPATPPPDTLLDATPVKLRLSDELSSARAHVGDVVHYEVMEDVLASGVVVIRKGSTAIGTVTQAEHAKSRGRAGKLDLSISYVPLADQEKRRAFIERECTFTDGTAGRRTGEYLLSRLQGREWALTPPSRFGKGAGGLGDGGHNGV